jgi:hypothetical protein
MPEEILDLDAIVPEPRKIRFEGNIITVNPPKMGELMAMFKFGRKMQDADPNTTDYEPIMEEIKSILVKIVPELEGKEINLNQMLALSTLISQMATPTQISEVNIEAAEEKKT